jgi:hypothetical protein
MSKLLPALPLVALTLAVPAQAQNYDDMPPLAPLSEAEVRSLPAEYRTAPVTSQVTSHVTETREIIDGVETITRTRRIDLPAAPPRGPMPQGQAHGYAPAMAYAPAPVVFERDQWLDECRRRTRGQNKDDTGTIIGGLLGAIAGGFAGYEIAGAGDRVLGTALGVGGGSLLGGLLGSLFNGRDEDRYDCEAALDAYLTQYGTPGTRVASREIAYAPYPAQYSYGYGYPAYGYAPAYAYTPPPQMVMVPVRSQVQQQVVVRETVREERYAAPGAARLIPAPSPKMIKGDR